MPAVIDILIKTAKEGNADVEVIKNLEALKSKSAGASEGVKKLSEAQEQLKAVGSRAVESLLRQAGVSDEALKGVKALEIGIERYAAGTLSATIATGGLVAIGSILVTKTYEMAKAYDALGKAQLDSESALNFILTNRKNVLERTLVAQRELRLNTATDAASKGALDSAAVDLFALPLQAQSRQIAAAAQARKNTLSFQNQAVGAAAFGGADLEREIARAGLESQQAEATAELEKEVAIRDRLIAQAQEQRKIAEEATYKTQAERNALFEIAEETDKLVEQQKLRAQVAAEKQKALNDLYADELALIDKRRGLAREEAERSAAASLLSVKEQFTTALEKEFQLEAAKKGIDDARVLSAYAYLQVRGRTADAERLLTLQLTEQNKLLKTASQRAAAGIVSGRGINVEALVSRGANLQERSLNRSLASDFNQELGAERTRLQRSGVRDPGAQKQQLESFAASLLEKFPTLKAQLGVTDAQNSPTEKQKLLKSADTGRLAEDASKSAEQATKSFRDLNRNLKLFTDDIGIEIVGMKQQLRAVSDKIRSK